MGQASCEAEDGKLRKEEAIRTIRRGCKSRLSINAATLFGKTVMYARRIYY